jgi:hypothetical protein
MNRDFRAFVRPPTLPIVCGASFLMMELDQE